MVHLSESWALCSVCNGQNDIENMLTEEIYFIEYGKWCQECYNKHLKNTYEYDGKTAHFCCQDFKNSNGEYVHYNLPYWSKQ